MDLNTADQLLTLIPSDPTVVRYTNQSLIVLCRLPSIDAISAKTYPTERWTLYWKSPKGEFVGQHRANRIHVEEGRNAGKKQSAFEWHWSLIYSSLMSLLTRVVRSQLFAQILNDDLLDV